MPRACGVTSDGNTRNVWSDWVEARYPRAVPLREESYPEVILRLWTGVPAVRRGRPRAWWRRVAWFWRRRGPAVQAAPEHRPEPCAHPCEHVDRGRQPGGRARPGPVP